MTGHSNDGRRRAFRTIAVTSAAVIALSACSALSETMPPGAPVASSTSLTSTPRTSQSDSTLRGSLTRPALTSEGEAVTVRLASGILRTTVIGPEVPGQGLPFRAGTTTCTWTITIEGADAAAAFSLADFTVIDHFGGVYHPTLLPTAPVDGAPAVPAATASGSSATFTIRTVMRVGEGLVRWSPGQNGTVASWDFIAEND